MRRPICCYPGCEREVFKGHLACGRHWHSVDATIRRQVQWRLNGWHDREAALSYLKHFFNKMEQTRNDRIPN